MTNASPADIPVVILAGGRGTRLSEVSGILPKPMVPVAGRPLILYIINHYSNFGFRKFIICAGYLSHVIKEYFSKIHLYHGTMTVKGGDDEPNFSDSIPADWVIKIVDTGQDTLTAGRLRRVQHLIDAPNFCLTYGDGITDLPIDKELAFHLAHGKQVTVASVPAPARFGRIIADDNGLVTNFSEKETIHTELINGGYFIMRREFLDRLPIANVPLEGEPLFQATKDGQLMAYRHFGFWQCVDTPRDLTMLEEAYQSGRISMNFGL
jgi:glucose-1-phosphate cytidylyltransferase